MRGSFIKSIGLPTKRGITECRRKFFTGCSEAPKSARPVAYASFANFATLLIRHWRHASYTNSRTEATEWTEI